MEVGPGRGGGAGAGASKLVAGVYASWLWEAVRITKSYDQLYRRAAPPYACADCCHTILRLSLIHADVGTTVNGPMIVAPSRRLRGTTKGACKSPPHVPP